MVNSYWNIPVVEYWQGQVALPSRVVTSKFGRPVP